jgi:adenylate cyclase
MRVAVRIPFAEDHAAGPGRGNPEPKRLQPDLRLIDGVARPAVRPAEQRLAVIAAADMVDYTRHMAADQAGTNAWCRSARRTIIEPALAEHGARIVKHTGDGFIAEFSSATRAVWFAVRFQDAVRAWNARRKRDRRLEFRVGINLGDVIVEANDLFGRSVNVAARLEALARPGGVLVSHAVVASVRGPLLRFEDAGELALKNVDEPVRGFHVRLSAPAGSRSARNGARPPAVGCVAAADGASNGT